jgi:excisionase family DNA binding protein
MESVCIGREQAAEALDLSLRGIDYLISRGKLRAIRVGRRVLIPRTEIERFAAGSDPAGQAVQSTLGNEEEEGGQRAKTSTNRSR